MQAPNPPPLAIASRGQFNSLTNPQVVLIGASTRSAAESAARAGIRCVCIDLFADLDTRQSAQVTYRIDRAEQITSILQAYTNLPIVCVGDLPGMISQLSRHSDANFPWVSPPAWGAARDLTRLRSAGNKVGLMLPPTQQQVPVARGWDRDWAKLSPRPERWLRKDVSRSGGCGIGWFDPKHDRPPSTSTVYQKWIPGHAFGATFLSDGSTAHLIGVCRSSFTRIQRLPFVYCGSTFGRAVLPPLGPAIYDRLKGAIELMVNETGVRGLLNLDFIVDRQKQVWLLEINPRWSGACEVFERARTSNKRASASRETGSLFGDAFHVAQGNANAKEVADRWQDDLSRSTSTVIKRVLFARRNLRVSSSVWQSLNSDGCTLHDLPHGDNPSIKAGHPVLTAIFKNDELGSLGAWNIRNPINQIHRALEAAEVAAAEARPTDPAAKSS